MSLRVAVLHGKPLRDESASNAARIASALRLAESAAAVGSGLLVLPELFLCDGKSKAAQPADGPLLDGIATLCATVGIAVCVTYCEVDEDGRRYSAAAVFDRTGKLCLHRRKARLGPGLEGRMYAPGEIESCASPAELRGALVDEPHSAVRLGVIIGSELEHPATAQLLALRGAQLLLVPSSTQLPESTVSTRARDNRIGVALSSPGNAVICDATGSKMEMESVSVEGGELRVGLLEVGDQAAMRLQCDLDLDRVLANELLGIADDAALTEARNAASKEADEMSASLRRTLQALREEDLDDDQAWSGSDMMAAFGCVMCNLLVGTALAAIAAILLMAEPADSPCRRATAGEGGVAGISACVANLASTAVATGRGEQFPQHVCTTASPWAQAALRTADLCPITSPDAVSEPEHSTPALLSMDVQHGGFILLGRRFFGSSSTVSIWAGDNPSDVAEEAPFPPGVAPGPTTFACCLQRWLARNGGGTLMGESHVAARKAVTKLLVDAARQTRVDDRIVPWASIPIVLGGVDAPLPVFESDTPLDVAQWYVAKQNQEQGDAMKAPLGPADVQAVTRAVTEALAAPATVPAQTRPVPAPDTPPPPLPELLFVLPVSDGTNEFELEVFAGDVPKELAQRFVTQHDLSHIADDAVSQIEAAILAEHQRLASLKDNGAATTI